MHQISRRSFLTATALAGAAFAMPAGAGASATDMANFMIAHLNGGALGDKRILGEKETELMHARLRGHDRIVSDRCRIRPIRSGNHFDFQPLAPNLDLLDGSGAKRVARRKQ